MPDLSVNLASELNAVGEHLVVEDFLKTIVDARALKTGFELGVIDRLMESRHWGSSEALGRSVGADAAGMRLLLDLLSCAGIVEERSSDVRLTARFRSAMRFRDLLEAKLDFAGFVLTDFADLFTALVRAPTGFMERARLFQLFDYRRCLAYSQENYARTRVWMRLTSTLSRYESLAALRLHNFGAYRHVLDVGGNSGEFALRLCRRFPNLRATVFDLPLVCEIGMEHILGEPEHERIRFVKGDLRAGSLPSGFDLIAFKSMLHDWPAKETAEFLGKASEALEPGGSLVIFERGPLRFRGTPPPFSLLPSLLFFRSYRAPSEYLAQLGPLGFEAIETHEIGLESPFFMITARKPGKLK